MTRSLAEAASEMFKENARRIRAQAERDLEEWEAIPEEERARLLKQFTRPDGTICEHWWQPEVEGWG